MQSLPLLEVEPELGAGLSTELRETANAKLRVPMLWLAPGTWEPPAEGPSTECGYLVTAGMLLRRVTLEGGRSAELLAGGDYLQPGREEPTSFSVAEWQVVDRTRLAVLDLRPGSPIARWPAIAATIASRAVDRSRRLALQSAIMSVVGTEARLLAMLWALAERWGRLTPEGTELKLNVSQDVLAELVGARRPTVSTALGVLADEGLVEGRGPGAWLLKGAPPDPAPGLSDR